ncbi:hydrogenase accessory protein HypB [candidate division KSB1 bacterium]|nr:MAG: hydrogenase accessory protein HypB [candidate division KSB1 bacterium]
MKTIHTEDGKVIEIKVNKQLFGKNNELAAKNLELFNKHNIHAIDVLGSIGSGKTSTIQQIVKYLKDKKRIAAITGDLTTTIDADRIKKYGAHVLQINTDRGCHLDANMVRNSLDQLNLEDYDLILIENVGNLICPGSYPVGAHQRIVVVSTTEGPYMIVKHPHIFQDATVAVINKTDMADAMDVDIKQLEKDAKAIKPSIKVVFTNAKTGQGIEDLVSALNI